MPIKTSNAFENLPHSKREKILRDVLGEVPTPEPLPKFPLPREDGGLWTLANITVTWDFLMAALSFRRDKDGLVQGLAMRQVKIICVPREYWDIQHAAARERESYGIRPGENCIMVDVTFESEALKDQN